jgi:Zn-dependent protease
MFDMSLIFGLFTIFVVVCSAIIHEYMHGWAANELGDPTARYQGRLTLDPRAHLDPFGSVILPLLLTLTGTGLHFAYAKPVPYNTYNLKDQRWGPVWIALAGPASNLFLATFFGVVAQLFAASLNPLVYTALTIIVIVNVALAVFNMVPIPPLDGSKLLFALMPDSAWRYRQAMEQYGMILFIIFLISGVGIISPIISGLAELLLTWM